MFLVHGLSQSAREGYPLSILNPSRDSSNPLLFQGQPNLTRYISLSNDKERVLIPALIEAYSSGTWVSSRGSQQSTLMNEFSRLFAPDPVQIEKSESLELTSQRFWSDESHPDKHRRCLFRRGTAYPGR